MARLTFAMMVSLDGFIESRNGDLDWVLIDEELHRHANEEARKAEVFIYGRRLYEAMLYWGTPESQIGRQDFEVEFSQIWRSKPKIVFSRTLDSVGDSARLMRDGVAGEIARLKAQPGGDITIGGPSLAAEAMRLGLIDSTWSMCSRCCSAAASRCSDRLKQVQACG
ncbi:MAG: bifunctional deaminase-reductase domain protein [Hyphomicrobiales bacterium]|nr:bifunctional deaminase-reductase domain protein [Hyphomicrobiales bacterium]